MKHDCSILGAFRRGHGYYPLYSFADGYPSGRVGLYSTVANTTFDYILAGAKTQVKDMLGRWMNDAMKGKFSSTGTIHL